LVTIIKVPFSVVNLHNIRNGLILIGNMAYLKPFNSNAYLLDHSKCYVYMILNSSETTVSEWLSSHFRADQLDKFIRQKIFTTYNQFSDAVVERISINNIMEISDFAYWENPGNCFTSITQKWSERKINLSLKWNIPLDEINALVNQLVKVRSEKTTLTRVTKPVIERKSQKENGNYPHVPVVAADKTKQRDDYVRSLGINHYIDGRSSDRSSYFVPSKAQDQTLEKALIKELLMGNTLTTKETLFLISNLLVSKNYSHYVIGDMDIMNKHKDIWDKYAPLFRYLLGYTFATLYKEESYKRISSTTDDRHILDIRAACKLPVYQFVQEDPRSSPYFHLYVNEESIHLTKNIGGVSLPLEYQKGIVELDEFKRRLNIFATGSADKDVFEGVDWSHMVVTGGSMAGIIPKVNPLMGKETPSDADLKKYFAHHYGSSDIDIACNFNNFLDYIEHVKNLKMILAKNHGIKESTVKIVPVNTACIYIEFETLREKCKNKEIPFDIKYLVENKNKSEVKDYFYELYLENKRILNMHNRQILGKKINDSDYYALMRIPSIDDFTVIFRDNVNDIRFGKRTAEADKTSSSGIEMIAMQDRNMQLVQDTAGSTGSNTSDVFFTTVDNLRFKITSKSFLHSFEVFRIDYDAFFSCVSRFHFPCVRAYYNGTTCYMTTSAFCSYMTLINNEYKYFSGSQDPIVIIKKYRERGYTSFFNDSEINQYIAMELIDDERKKLFGVKTLQEYEKLLGFLPSSHPIFTGIATEDTSPEIIKTPLAATKKNSPAKKDVSPTSDNRKPIEKTADYFKKHYHSFDPFFCKHRTINTDGNIQPIKRWLIEAAYDSVSSKN